MKALIILFNYEIKISTFNIFYIEKIFYSFNIIQYILLLLFIDCFIYVDNTNKF